MARRGKKPAPPPTPACAACGTDRHLTEHHIHPKEYAETYAPGVEAINDKANLVILCSGCHFAVHSPKSYGQIRNHLKTRLRQGLVIKGHHDQGQLEQSIKDQMAQHDVWEHLVRILVRHDVCQRIEGYRRIIRTVERYHRKWLEENTG